MDGIIYVIGGAAIIWGLFAIMWFFHPDYGRF